MIAYQVGNVNHFLPKEMTTFPPIEKWQSPQELQKTAQTLYDWVQCCKIHNFKDWWVIGGTLIGQVRHHGVIPWDDDVDICVPLSFIHILLDQLIPEMIFHGYKCIYRAAFGYQLYPPGSKLYPHRPTSGVLDIFICELVNYEFIYSFPILKNGYSTLHCGKNIWPNEIMHFDVIYPLQNGPFEWFDGVQIPNQSKKYITMAYGIDALTQGPTQVIQHKPHQEYYMSILETFCNLLIHQKLQRPFIQNKTLFGSTIFYIFIVLIAVLVYWVCKKFKIKH